MPIVAADRNSAAHRRRVRWPVFLVAALGLIGLGSPGSEAVAQAIGAQDGVEDAKKKTAGTGETAPPRGKVYTWRDGDRTRRAFLQSDLVVREDTAARAGPRVVVRVPDTVPNGFVVATEPGFAALELANALAGEDGVVLSSPNWWREHTTR